MSLELTGISTFSGQGWFTWSNFLGLPELSGLQMEWHFSLQSIVIQQNNINYYCTHSAGRMYCSLLFLLQHWWSTLSSMTPLGGKVITGHGGGSLTRRPQIVVRFFISLPHLNLFLLLVRIARICSLRCATLTSCICEFERKRKFDLWITVFFLFFIWLLFKHSRYLVVLNNANFH